MQTIQPPPATPQKAALYPTVTAIYRVASAVSAAAGAYHGYKRNKSVGWAIGWFFFGGLIPPLAIGIALAQGFGKRKVGR